MSKQERLSWISLAICLALAGWYFSTVFALPADVELHGRTIGRFVARVLAVYILLAVAVEIVMKWLQRREPGGVQIDERDRAIELKAVRNAGVALYACIAAVLWQIFATERFGRAAVAARADTVLERLATGPLGASHVAQLLLLSLVVASLTTYASRIVYHRRGS